ncbi:MAG: patatin-like phospholipase family protein [Myxococcales bacterium]|nr:patatin-like phospholipase family protein [Myxococcales bacterium]USN50199.1 MAG: patatin-like phospholipase family protein [Myxococcales bacterium]
MGHLNDGASRQLRRRIQQIECEIVRLLCDEPDWLDTHDSASLRWALSLARLTRIKNPDISLGHASDRYRAELYALLSEALLNGINKEKIKELLPSITVLAKKERRDLLSLFSLLTPEILDEAVRRRPLALTMSGGGGTAFVFVGALYALEESGITPSVISGSSMGAILGAYRARTKHFSFDGVDALVEKTSWGKIAQSYSGPSRFGVPATFRLYLRDVVGHEFEYEDRFMRLKDLEIPLRVCVAGLCSQSKEYDEELAAYAHAFDENPKEKSRKSKSVISLILDFAQKPLKAVYLGGDELTAEFDVLDAIGFSAAIPGIFHYDIMRNDPRMIALVSNLFAKEGIFRLIDGGFVDNLPMQEAINAVAEGICDGYDPFALALDSFSPGFNRHILFYPLMRFATENSRVGHEASDLTIFFREVLSPINLVPTKKTFQYAIDHGHREFSAHLPFIRKMVGPIPDPSWLKESLIKN